MKFYYTTTGARPGYWCCSDGFEQGNNFSFCDCNGFHVSRRFFREVEWFVVFWCAQKQFINISTNMRFKLSWENKVSKSTSFLNFHPVLNPRDNFENHLKTEYAKLDFLGFLKILTLVSLDCLQLIDSSLFSLSKSESRNFNKFEHTMSFCHSNFTTVGLLWS